MIGGKNIYKRSGKNYSMTRMLNKGCPKLLKMVDLAKEQMEIAISRKPRYQYVANPRLTVSHNTFTKQALRGHSLLQ